MDGWDEFGDVRETEELTEVPEPIEEVPVETVDVSDVMDNIEPLEEAEEFTESSMDVNSDSYVDSVMDAAEMEVPEFDDDVKVLKRDETELWQEGNSAIEDTLEAMRDDLRDKGLEDGPEMEAMIAHEKTLMQQELAENIQGDFSHPYDGPSWQKVEQFETDASLEQEGDIPELNEAEELRPIDEMDKWLEEVNPNFDPFDMDSPYCNNCGSCAYAVYKRLEGDNEICATEENIGYNDEMEALTGMEQVSMSPEDIQARLLEAGDGAHAIIGIDREVGPGHWFNAANIDGKVVAIDGQSGEITDWPPDYGNVTNWEMSIKKETEEV